MKGDPLRFLLTRSSYFRYIEMLASISLMSTGGSERISKGVRLESGCSGTFFFIRETRYSTPEFGALDAFEDVGYQIVMRAVNEAGPDALDDE